MTTLPGFTERRQFRGWANNNVPGKKGFQSTGSLTDSQGRSAGTTGDSLAKALGVSTGRPSSAPPSRSVDSSAARGKVEAATPKAYERPKGSPEIESMGSQTLVDWRAPIDRKPAFVQPDEHFGGYTVQAGYYGTSFKGRPLEFTNKQPDGKFVYKPIRQPVWAVEMPGGRANAQRIARNDAGVSAVVGRHGGSARVSVEFKGSQMHVRDYDYARWSEIVDALP